MSAYTTLKTHMVSVEHILQALKDMGFEIVEAYDRPQALIGYEGLARKQKAEIIIRKKHVGFASNDIGFRKNTDGRYEAIISEFDRETYNKKWLDQLNQRYAYHVAREKMTEKGFDLIQETVDENNSIRLTLRRMA